MKKQLQRLREFLQREDGPTSVEYAVMAGLIFLAVITVVQVLGGATSDSLQESADQIETAFNAQGQN